MNITEDELRQFKSVPVDKKVVCMALYLIGSPTRRYNMQEVACRVFGQENYSFTVSLIHRCYNFSGNNGGRYRNGCSFEQTYGYRVTPKDIEAFVKQYPGGTFDKGITFEDFLLARIHKTQSVPRQMDAISPDMWQEKEKSDTAGTCLTVVLVICILIIILILIFGSILKYWKICLVCAIIAVAAYQIRDKRYADSGLAQWLLEMKTIPQGSMEQINMAVPCSLGDCSIILCCQRNIIYFCIMWADTERTLVFMIYRAISFFACKIN